MWKFIKSTLILSLVIIAALAWPKITRYVSASDSRLRELSGRSERIFMAEDASRRLLGDQLGVGKIVAENLKEEGDSGKVGLNIEVYGNRRKGLLNVEATERNGNWSIDKLDLKPEGEQAWWNLLRSDGKEE